MTYPGEQLSGITVVLLWDLGLLGVAVLAAGVVGTAWRNRPRAGATWLAATMACVATWALAHLVTHHAAGPVAAALEKLQFAALVPVGFLVFAFVLAYTGRRRYLARRGLVALFAWPAVLIALVWLPADVAGPLAVWPGVRAESGPVYWGHVALTYGLLAVGTALLVDHVRSAVGLFRRQALAVLAGLLLAWAGSLVSALELFGSVHLHTLQVGLAGMGLCFLWGVVSTGLTGVSPVARRTIVRTLDAGVLAVDDEHRVTTTNPAARRLLALPEPAAVAGEPVEDVLSAHPELAEWLGEFDADTGGVSRRFVLGDRVVTCELSPLSDDRDRFIGAAAVLWDVTEQQHRREELERQNERLDQFASRLSHDLRSPLAVATGNLELAREADGADEAALETAQEALEHMETLIEDLRALAEAGRSIEDTERVDLADAVAGAWRVVDAPDATVTVEADGVIRADPDRLRRLLVNLFGNAVEHGSTSPSSNDRPDAADHDDAVAVRVGATPDGFYVADDGPGIPAADREDVFEEGYSTGDGMGLGLTIVGDVVEAHGWDVAVTEAVDGGARFEVSGVDRPDSS